MNAPKVSAGSALALARRLDGVADPLALYRALSSAGTRKGTLLFETADSAGDGVRRSIIVERTALTAVCRGPTVRLVALSPNGCAALAHVVAKLAGRAEIVEREEQTALVAFPARRDVPDADQRLRASSPMDALRAMTSFATSRGDEPYAVFCAGVFAYDMVDAFESLPAPLSDPLQYPDYSFFLAESLVVMDREALRTTVLCTAFGSDDTERGEASYFGSAARLADLVERCRTEIGRAENARSARPRAGGDQAAAARAEATADLDDGQYCQVVARLQEHILAGDVFQVVPSRTFKAPCSSPIDAYERLRASEPSPYMFFVADRDSILFGASPETSVRVSRREHRDGTFDRTVEIRPIAGTRRRGLDERREALRDLDDRLEIELSLDPKELAEHVMLVDLARNDVARVSEPGTRFAARLLSVEKYSRVMHLASRVEGKLKPELDALHAVAASMNMATLVGAPKVRAAELLRGTELTKRGPYGGAVGYLTGAGDFDSAIVIRSALVKDGVAHVRAGAGVVVDSIPEREADESRRKAESVLAALAAPDAALSRPSAARALDTKSVLLIDNFDSFTWNLVEAFERLSARVRVVRNTIGADEAIAIARASGSLIVVSPGPGAPEEAGSTLEIIAKAKGRVPLFGVCLGHQAIVREAGGDVGRADQVVHGRASSIDHDGKGPFAGLPTPLSVGRYHSLATRRLPGRFRVHAAIGDMVMALSDPEALQVGVQFHPESVLTQLGDRILENVLAFASERRAS